jgi:hypothetical protein
MYKSNLNKLVVAVFYVTLLTALLAQTSQTVAQTEAQIVSDPLLAPVNSGDNFTITINATNIAALGAWQLALKYNASVINITSIWIPEGTSVFGSLTRINVEPQFGQDIRDLQGYVIYGASLLGDVVSVSNGILCLANFTALAEGQTNVYICTRSNAVHISQYDYDAFYSQLLDANTVEVPYTVKNAIVINGAGGSAKPTASFTLLPSLPDRTAHLVVDGNRPAGDVQFTQTYKDYFVTFNGSGSLGLLRLQNGTQIMSNAAISKYIWDFGDLNVTITDSPILNHTYTSTGKFTPRLSVEDNEDPPESSDTAEKLIMVGLVLDYFNWAPFVYVVIAIIIAAAIFYGAKELRGYFRTRREIKARRMLLKSKKPISEPGT